MARRVFFSFHFDRDIRRVVQIRNSWVVRAERETQTFVDKAEWESIKRTGNAAIEEWIEDQLAGTSVTVVMVGKETFDREWVRHEIKRSYQLKKGLLPIYIHNVRDPQKGIDARGKNPLDYWTIEQNGRPVPISNYYQSYDWVDDGGYANFSSWIDAAAKAAGR